MKEEILASSEAGFILEASLFPHSGTGRCADVDKVTSVGFKVMQLQGQLVRISDLELLQGIGSICSYSMVANVCHVKFIRLFYFILF